MLLSGSVGKVESGKSASDTVVVLQASRWRSVVGSARDLCSLDFPHPGSGGTSEGKSYSGGGGWSGSHVHIDCKIQQETSTPAKQKWLKIGHLPCWPVFMPQMTGEVRPLVPETTKESTQRPPVASPVSVGPAVVKVSKSKRTAQTSKMTIIWESKLFKLL